MNVKVVLVCLIVTIGWPFVLAPRSFSLTVDPTDVIAVARGGSLPSPQDCYYFTLFGDRLSEGCPPRVPPVEVLYQGTVEIVNGRIIPSKPAVTVRDQIAYEILVPIEVLLVLGGVFLSRKLRSPENESRRQEGPLGLGDL
jgi:hypothetical protein